MGKKSWKEYLLSSGVPLEHSVIKILKSYGFDDLSEFKYIRGNEQGIETLFSVDIKAKKYSGKSLANLSLLLECKYRHDQAKWIFVPSEYECFGIEFRDLFISTSELSESVSINSTYLNKFADRYALCGKGVEILDNSFNPKAIEQAISQVSYALPNLFVKELNSQALGPPTIKDKVRIIIPFIVTTAQLWRLNEETTIENIRHADNLDEVAKEYDLLLIRREPDNFLATYTLEILQKNLGQYTMDILNRNEAIDSNGFISRFARQQPSVFVVIHYSRVEQMLQNLIPFIESDNLLKPKKYLASDKF